MSGGKRLNPRLESLLVFAVVIGAAALSAFIRSRATGQPFSLNWSVALLAAAACDAIVYLGPPLLYRLKSEMRERREKKER